MQKVVIILAAALLAFPATGLAQHDDVKADFEAMSMKWKAAYDSGDGAAVAALYAEDAMLLPPNMDPVSGREAIAEFWTMATAAGGTTDLKVKEVYSMGDMAAEVGTYSGTNADGSHADHGHYTIIWKKVDGKWMMYRDMWNSDMP
ncbi:MAG: nuclear transport factor 2 family protein [marine benthic group bacterium]|jgi:uncharacterized protein (TIGR02246 family)|nr:nuclear transport factor 2 family protein [Candidatus Benthicola marisminoris]